LVTDGKDGLDSDVHDHETLGTKAEGQDLQSVCDEKAGPTEEFGQHAYDWRPYLITNLML